MVESLCQIAGVRPASISVGTTVGKFEEAAASSKSPTFLSRRPGVETRTISDIDYQSSAQLLAAEAAWFRELVGFRLYSSVSV